MKKNKESLVFGKKEIEQEGQENWDIKRIIIGTVILISLIGFGYFQYSNSFKNEVENPKTGIFGAFSRDQSLKQPEQKIPEEIENLKNLEIPSREKIQEIILQAQETISEITPENAASSSQELQKLINDLSAVQNKSKEPKDLACELICGSEK
ncbi:hypothetical protein C4577_06655 [Candidatus Parcubacteria bacterium]|nr:MAG: hypothetical protein C4577_06655 [Candidatus Parcubacteria bacterium]